MRLEVCTVLSGKELHRQVGMGRVLTSESLGGVMVRTLSQMAREIHIKNWLFIMKVIPN